MAAERTHLATVESYQTAVGPRQNKVDHINPHSWSGTSNWHRRWHTFGLSHHGLQVRSAIKSRSAAAGSTPRQHWICTDGIGEWLGLNPDQDLQAQAQDLTWSGRAGCGLRFMWRAAWVGRGAGACCCCGGGRGWKGRWA